MIKLIQNWLIKRRLDKETNQYVKGYNFAAGELLRGTATPQEIESYYYRSSWTPFDRGCNDAIDRLVRLNAVIDNRT